MKSSLNKILIFAVGAAIGSAVTWKILDEKYKNIVQEEMDSMNEYFKTRVEELEDETESTIEKFEELRDRFNDSAKVTSEKPDIREYAAKIQKEGYTDYTNNAKPKSNPVKDDAERPYVISPEEYGELEYEEIELTYYADGVLADDMNNKIDDVDDVVGLDSLDQFGEYEEDSVHVRNDRLKCDFEILLDSRNYTDVIKYDPHHAED